MKNSIRFTGILLFAVYFLFPASANIGIPPSVITGLGNVQPEAHLQLQVPDIDHWIEEDRLNENRGVPFRIGAFRPLPSDSVIEADRHVDEQYGLIWRLAITSPEALELKIQLIDINLTGYDELYIYAENEIESEIYTRDDVFADGSLWSWGSPGETIILEWHRDVSAATVDFRNPPFTVAGISHIYKDIRTVAASREGNCHNDATCDTGFIHQRDASAHIEFNDGGTYICSGTMLNNQSHNFTPYFLTADHCISTQSAANSVKAWFFFHTDNCDDPPPSRGYRTVSGATLMAHGPAQNGNGSDFSLIRLNNSDYTGVYFAGWDRTAQGIGTAVTAIHHPDGAYKRISYGTIRSTWYDGQWGVNWDRTANPGVTEGGSSGGALFNNANHRVVGQLWAGSSACNNQNGRDFYGRFSMSFNNGNLGQWLGNVNSVDGAYWSGGGPTATPAPPTFTPTPKPTGSHVPTNTPNPSWTPTPAADLAVDIVMPSTMYKPGDPFGCSVVLYNNTGTTYSSLPLFVILDVMGDLFFLPDFNEFSYYSIHMLPGNQTQVVVPVFEWPAGVGSADGILWYAAFTNSEFTEMLGTYDMFSFGWTE